MINEQELRLGTNIEHEHTQDDALAAKIAMDHLGEDPHYYSKLMAAGLADDDEAGLAPQTPATVGAVPATQTPSLKSTGLGQGQQPSLKSSNLGSAKPKDNTVAVGKTLPQTPEPAVVGGGVVNKTTGAKMPNNVVVGRTPPLGGSQPMTSVAVVSTSDPMEFFGSQINSVCDDCLEEGGSVLKKQNATQG